MKLFLIRIAFALIVFATFMLTYTGCQTVPVPSVPVPASNACELDLTPEKLQWGPAEAKTVIVQMPVTGKMIVESHYITKQDGLTPGSLTSVTDRISGHLARACEVLSQKFGVTDCKKAHAASYERQWNGQDPKPPGAQLGVGGRWWIDKSMPPDSLTEMFTANMYWSSVNLPKYPTKYLISTAAGKHVVVNMGYEQGPPKQWVVGVQPEIRYFLGVQNEATVTVGRLKDQSLPYGPIDCAVKP